MRFKIYNEIHKPRYFNSLLYWQNDNLRTKTLHSEVISSISAFESKKIPISSIKYFSQSLGNLAYSIILGVNSILAYFINFVRFRKSATNSFYKVDNFNSVWDAIKAISAPIDFVLFRTTFLKSLTSRNPRLADVVFLTMQLGDEFLDLITIHLGKKEIEELYQQGIKVFSVTYNGTKFEFPILQFYTSLGVDKHVKSEKFNRNFSELHFMLRQLLAEINQLIISVKKGIRENVVKELEIFFKICLDSYFVDLKTKSTIELSDYNSAIPYYYTKNNMMFMQWLTLRATLLDKDLSKKAISKINEWGWVMANFQIFDDLKDCKIDYSYQYNYLLINAYNNFKEEYDWFEENISHLSDYCSFDEIVSISLSMPASVNSCLLHCKSIVLHNCGWLTKLISNYRWSRNWTDSDTNFYNQKKGFGLNEHELFTSFVETENYIINIVFNVIINLSNSWKYFDNDNMFLDYVFIISFYDISFRKSLMKKVGKIKIYRLMYSYIDATEGKKAEILKFALSLDSNNLAEALNQTEIKVSKEMKTKVELLIENH